MGIAKCDVIGLRFYEYVTINDIEYLGTYRT